MVRGVSLQERCVIGAGVQCDTGNWLTRWKGQSFFISLRLQRVLCLSSSFCHFTSLILSLRAPSFPPRRHTFQHWPCTPPPSLPPSRRQLVSFINSELSWICCSAALQRSARRIYFSPSRSSLSWLCDPFRFSPSFPPVFLFLFLCSRIPTLSVSIHILSSISSEVVSLLAWLHTDNIL